MKTLLKYLFIAAFLLVATPLLPPGSDMVIAAELKHSSTGSDRSSVTLTIYSTGPALIAETRDLMLASPRGALTLLDVPVTIRPETLRITARDKRGGAVAGFKPLEAAFSYDLASNNKILKKFVGEEVLLIEDNKFQDRTKRTRAKLLRIDGGPVFLIDGEVHLNHPGRIVLAETEGVSLAPELSLRYKLPRPTAVDLTAVYMAGGLGWSVDYSLTLGESEGSALLSGWITIRNSSGMDFKGANINVVAGDINRAPEQRYGRMDRAFPAMKEAFAAPETKGLFDYYLIELPGEKTVMDGESRQFAYMNSTITGVRKEYTISDRPAYRPSYRPAYQDGADVASKLPVEVSVIFENSKENNAGFPLPGGTVRIYHKKDNDAIFFTGEARIGNIPQGAEVRVKSGNAFDITAKRRTTDYKRIRARLHEEAVSVTIKNSKKEPVTVTVKSSLRGISEVLSSSEPYKKLDAFTIGFDVTVPPGGETILTYRYRSEE